MRNRLRSEYEVSEIRVFAKLGGVTVWQSNFELRYYCLQCKQFQFVDICSGYTSRFWELSKYCSGKDGTDLLLYNRTRKVSYCKDDRAMRPIYECPEYFQESLSTPTATFPKIFNGLLFRSIL